MKHFILLLLLPIALVAQTSSEIKVVGKVIDSETNEPLPFATVALLNSVDNSADKTTLTDETGSFVLIAAPGDYYLKIQYVGYGDKILKNGALSALKSETDLGTIKLNSGG